MMHAKAGSSTSAKQREGLPLDSSRPVAPQKSGKYPPRYGAQHRQDALWEGGSEALPPGWTERKAEGDDRPLYRDGAVFVYAAHRPLPGVRLDDPWDLIPGCEWHISPLGRSYFVNHNTRTTSWKKPRPERPAGSLMPECIIKRDSPWCSNGNLTWLGTSGDILSISDDGSICQWTRAGKPVGKPFHCEGEVVHIISMVVSPDGLMAVGACRDGRVRLWNIKEGSLVGQPWEGNDVRVTCGCLDWSPNGAEVAGGSRDNIRRWNASTGRQIGPPIKGSNDWIFAIKYSPQSDKFASGGDDGVIRVWSRDCELLIEIKGHDAGVTSLCWSEDGAHIFSGSYDYTIRKWQSIDGRELVVLRGHTNVVRSLCLTPNERYIVSASYDHSVRIWDLKTNQAVGDPFLHDDEVWTVATSADGTFIASAGLDRKIYVWNLEAALERYQGVDDGNEKLKGRPTQPRVVRQPIPNTGGFAKYGNDFFADHSNRSTAPPENSSLLHWRSLFGSLRFSARPADAPRPRESKHWNFRLRPVGKSRHTFEVAPACDEDRYGITPETDAEAAAAMECTDGDEVDNSTQPGQSATAVQASQVQTQAQVSTSGPEDIMCGVNCCGTFFGFRRPASHQS